MELQALDLHADEPKQRAEVASPQAEEKKEKTHWRLFKSAADPRNLVSRKPSVWSEEQQEPVKKWFLVWLNALSCVRVVNLGLWLSLIGMYFSQVDGEFPQWSCSLSDSFYCSRELGAIESDCSLTGRMCSVDQGQSIPVFVFLSLSL